MFVGVELDGTTNPLLFKLGSMSNIFLEKDNITILGDIYEYPFNKYNSKNELIEKIKQKAIMIQIVIVMNGKQKTFRTNFDLEGYTREVLDGSEAESSSSIQLKDYTNWYILRDFLLAMGYDIDFNITNEIERANQDNLPYE